MTDLDDFYENPCLVCGSAPGVRCEHDDVDVVDTLDEITLLRRKVKALEGACRAALGAWCPHPPGGDGADADTYQRIQWALDGRDHRGEKL